MFFGALVTLVRNGLTDEDPALKGAYLNSYQVRGSEGGRGGVVWCGVVWCGVVRGGVYSCHAWP